MLKQANKRGSGTGSQRSAEMRLVKVLQLVVEDAKEVGIVAEYVDSNNGEKVFLEALPTFVAQKNAAPNFMAKLEGNKLHPKFYTGLMKPTSNPDHQFRKDTDTVSVKVYDQSKTKTVEGYGELPVKGISNGFVIFARGQQQRKDPLDDNITKMTPADRIVTGMARIVHDENTINKTTNEKGSTWIEVVRENGNPESMDALYNAMRDTCKVENGPNLFVRIVKDNNENMATGSYFPTKSADEVEADIKEMKDMGLTADRVYSWTIEPRIYLRKEFIVGQGESASKLERFLRDAQYTYHYDREKTPIEVNVVEATIRGNTQKRAGEGYFMPVAISQTLYQVVDPVSKEQRWVHGSVRAVVPVGAELLHSKQVYMTPMQRQVANSIATPATEDTPEAAVGTEPQAPAAEPTPTAESDIDFGFGGSQ